MRVEMILDGDFYEVKNKIVETFPNLIHLSFDGAEQDKWVSVEDRLPEECFLVWLCDSQNETYIGVRLGNNYYTIGDLVKGLEGIIYWQPLFVPEPPKGV